MTREWGQGNTCESTLSAIKVEHLAGTSCFLWTQDHSVPFEIRSGPDFFVCHLPVIVLIDLIRREPGDAKIARQNVRGDLAGWKACPTATAAGRRLDCELPRQSVACRALGV